MYGDSFEASWNRMEQHGTELCVVYYEDRVLVQFSNFALSVGLCRFDLSLNIYVTGATIRVQCK